MGLYGGITVLFQSDKKQAKTGSYPGMMSGAQGSNFQPSSNIRDQEYDERMNMMQDMQNANMMQMQQMMGQTMAGMFQAMGGAG